MRGCQLEAITGTTTLRPRQNGRHFPDDIFKWIFVNEIIWISIKISLRFVPRGRINNIPALVQIMAWRRPGDKPLSEPMMVSSLTHKCVTRPQWVNMRPRKMVAISQTTFWSAFSSTKMCEFRLNFYCSLFPCVQLTVFQHGFSHYLNQWWLVYWRIYASLDLNEWSQVSRDLTYMTGYKDNGPNNGFRVSPTPLQHNRNYIENITGLPKLRQQIVQRKKSLNPALRQSCRKSIFHLSIIFFCFTCPLIEVTLQKRVKSLLEELGIILAL